MGFMDGQLAILARPPDMPWSLLGIVYYIIGLGLVLLGAGLAAVKLVDRKPY